MHPIHTANIFTSKRFWVGCLILFVLAAWIRFNQHDVGFNLDEAEYVLASNQGFWANATDSNMTLQARHFHGPMVSYINRIGVLLGGVNESATRVLPRLIGALTCVLLFWGVLFIDERKFLAAFAAGFFLAILPTHAHLSGIGNMHPLAAMLILLCFIFTYKALVSGKKQYLFALAVLLGLLFVTIEYGFVIMMIIGLAFLLLPNRFLTLNFKKFSIDREMMWAVLLLILTVFLLWPAGIYKLNLVKNLLYYLRYSESGHPILFRGQLTTKVPWWAYIYWFGKLAPVWLGLAFSSLGYLLYRVIRFKFQVFDCLTAMFTLILLSVLLKQHIMSARYSAYVLPFLCLSAGIMLNDLIHSFKKWGPVFYAVVLSAVTVTNYPHWQPNVQGDAGYKEAAEYLQQNSDPSDRIITWYQPILKLYLPEFSAIMNYKRGPATPALVEQMQSSFFRYVIYYHNQVSRWPGDPGLVWVKNNYALKRTFYYKDKAVLWLYEAPGYRLQN